MKLKIIPKTMVASLMVSYIVLLVTPMLFYALLQWRTENSVRGNINKYNDMLVSQLASSIDSYQSEINFMTYQLANGTAAEKIMEFEKREDAGYDELAGLMSELKGYKERLSYIQDVYIYFDNTDMIVTSSNYRSAREFFESSTYKYADYNYDVWKNEFLSGVKYRQYSEPILIKSNAYQQKVIVYTQSVPLSDITQVKAHVIINIDIENILLTLNQLSSVTGGTACVLNSNGEYLITNNEIDRKLPQLNKITGRKTSEPILLKDSNEILIYSPSSQNDWIYAMITPVNMYDKDVQTLKVMSVVLAVLYLLLACVEVYYFYKINYNPLRGVVEYIKKKSALNHGSNELEVIIDEFSYMENVVTKSLPALKKDILEKLLKGRVKNGETLKRNLKIAEIEFPYVCFGVVTVSLDDFDDFITENTENEWELVRCAILNVANEIISAEYIMYSVEIEQRKVSFILNLEAAQEDEFYEFTEAKSKEICDFFHKNFEGVITVGISSVHNGIESIFECYKETLVALEVSGNENKVLIYDDINIEEQQGYYYYPPEVEAKINRCVDELDMEGICNAIDDVVELNLDKIKIQYSLKKCLCYDLFTTFLKTASRTSPTFWIDDYRIRDNLDMIEYSTLKNVVRIIKEDYKYLLDRIKSRCQLSENELIDKIERYINENYSDPNLSVAMIADKFNMSRQNLFLILKQTRNISPVDYIAEVRNKYARELLKDDTLNIAQIAYMVGYTNDTTFARAFKKCVGMTPGNYRKSMVEQ